MKPFSYHRFNQLAILHDLKKKMVFLTGPRQVGKTWLAKKIMLAYKKPVYLNYDSFKDQRVINEQSWISDSDLIIFDEIHKMDQWKNFIKGVYDTHPSGQHILVTGSARLQQISREGDSLAGRYLLHTLFPFSIFELKQIKKNITFKTFFARGGFPEPLLISKNINDVERWREQYMFSLLREDIPDLKNVQNYKKIKTLLYLLREQVGSPVSVYSLAQNLKVDHKTVNRYLSVLEDLFIIFQVPVFSNNISRSLYKSKKIYFYDFSFIESSHVGQRLENLVAIHLLKYCIYLHQTVPLKAFDLYYLRTKDQKEVDFLLVKKNRPNLMVEVKVKEVNFSNHLLYFYDRYNIPGKQICLICDRRRQIKNRQIILESITDFLLHLKI